MGRTPAANTQAGCVDCAGDGEKPANQIGRERSAFVRAEAGQARRGWQPEEAQDNEAEYEGR